MNATAHDLTAQVQTLNRPILVRLLVSCVICVS
jgi:hypothetical protein